MAENAGLGMTHGRYLVPAQLPVQIKKKEAEAGYEKPTQR